MGYSAAYPKYKQARVERGCDDAPRRLTKEQRDKYAKNYAKINWAKK